MTRIPGAGLANPHTGAVPHFGAPTKAERHAFVGRGEVHPTLGLRACGTAVPLARNLQRAVRSFFDSEQGRMR